MPRGRKPASESNPPESLASKVLNRRGSGTSVSSESEDGGGTRRRGGRRRDGRKVSKSPENDAKLDGETKQVPIIILERSSAKNSEPEADWNGGGSSVEVIHPGSSEFSQLRVDTESKSEDANLDQLEVITDSILISPTAPKSQLSSVNSLTTSPAFAATSGGRTRVHAAVVNYSGSGLLVDQLEELEDEFLQTSPRRNPSQDIPVHDDIYEDMEVDAAQQVESIEEFSNILEKCSTPTIQESPVESRDASPTSSKPKEEQSTRDSTAKKERRGRPKGSRNKPKNEAILSSLSTDAIKIGTSSKSGGERETHSSCSTSSTPRSLSPTEPHTIQTSVEVQQATTPVQKHLEKVRKGGHSRRRSSQDKQRPEGVEGSPLPLGNSPSRHKPNRRASKLSDSEESVVSIDSPLKPRNFTGPLPDSASDRKHHNKVSKFEREDRVEEGSSPVEEQPLIPHSYLQHRKREKEGKEKEVREQGKQDQEAKSNIKPEPKLSREEVLREEAEDRKEVERRLRGFKHITENLYLCQKKINKQFRKMLCDCDQSKEESERGELGCFDDCANRMLMIECGKDCPLENNCANKRIQNKENAKIEVFKTPWKGFGVRALEAISKDTFIMEYVGEALDHKQFRRRAKHYARTNVEHFYFMALSKDCYVDATEKGNISRFINHSCDPNSMTQKWMVNGENRVGFFTKRDVEAGEELNFDYKYERYGQAAQKCFCGTSICRGWLGREPTSDSGIDELEEWTTSEDEDEEDRQLEIKDDKNVKEEKKKKKERREKRRDRDQKRRRWREEEEWEEDMSRLAGTGIKNRLHTVLLCRLMVRASERESRLRLTQLLLNADRPCRRLFLDYQGLRILSQWMQDLEWSSPDLEMKLRIENVLAELPIPHKTMLKDSKVYSSMEVWSLATPAHPNPVIPDKQRDTEGAAETNISSSSSRGPSRRPSTTPSVTPCTTPAALPSTPSRPASAQSMDIDLQPSHSPIRNTGLSEEEDLYPPGEEPGSQSNAGCDIDDDIQVLEEIPGRKSSSRPASRNSDMKLKIVQLEDVDSSLEKKAIVPLPLDGARGVAKLLSAQSGVGGEEEEQLNDILVLPIHREELPLTEDEERERAQIISKVKEVQLRARELLDVWRLLQEVFKIPKKERHKIRVKHEREADSHFTQGTNAIYNLQTIAKNYAENNRLHHHQDPGLHRGGAVYTPDRANYGTPDRSSYYSPLADGGRGARNSWTRYQAVDKQRNFVVPRERRNLRLDDSSGRLYQSGLSREDRRTLFEAKIKEEAEQKTKKECLAARHAQCCHLLGLNPAVTPLFDTYPQYYLSGEKWLEMPPPPQPVPTEFVAPGMAWLPDEAYRGDDPRPVDPRDIYPPGVCPPAPPPRPKIIIVPGMRSVERDIIDYYEEMWRKAPKEGTTPTASPKPAGNAQQMPSKKEVPPYPGYPVQIVPDTIIFDPETLRAPPQSEPAPVPAPSALPPVEHTLPQPIDPSPRPQSSRSERSPKYTRSPRNHEHQSADRSRSRDTSPRGRPRHPRPVEQPDLTSDLQLLERVKEELNLSKTFDLSPDYRSPSPVQQKRSGRSVTPLVESGSPSPISGTPNDDLALPNLPSSTGLLPTIFPTPEIPMPVPAPLHTSPAVPDSNPSPRRLLPPKKIDFLSSAPEAADPFPSRRADLEPRELELCETGLVAYPGPDASYPNSELMTGEGYTAAAGAVTSSIATNGTVELTVKLPRRWKVARDGEGRVYYYHIDERVAQWEPPAPDQDDHQDNQYAEYVSNGGSEKNQEEDLELETNSSDDDDDEDEESDDEAEEKEDGAEEEAPMEEGLITGDQDLSSSEKRMLLRIRNRSRTSREERSTMRKIKRRRERARREQEREIIQARYQRHMESGLVDERVVPKDKSNASTFKEIRERLMNKEEVLKEIDKEIREDERREMAERMEAERQKRDLKKAEAAKRKAISGITEPVIPGLEIEPIETLIPVRHVTPAKPTTAAADTSSDAHRRVRDRFVKEMSGVIVNALNPYRNPKMKGHIKNSEDFKHLAKKLTYQIFAKEKERVRSLEDLKITDKMKAKAAEWVKKKMDAMEKTYKKSPK